MARLPRLDIKHIESAMKSQWRNFVRLRWRRWCTRHETRSDRWMRAEMRCRGRNRLGEETAGGVLVLPVAEGLLRRIGDDE